MTAPRTLYRKLHKKLKRKNGRAGFCPNCPEFRRYGPADFRERMRLRIEEGPKLLRRCPRCGLEEEVPWTGRPG